MVESIEDLFTRNASLFTVLGVFGAISVYFSQIGGESRWKRLGIVGSLIIFLLVANAIRRNIPPESSDQIPFDFIVNQQLKEPGFIIFYVAFLAVVVSISAVVLSFSNTLLFLISFFLVIIGVRIARWWMISHSPYKVTKFRLVDDMAGAILPIYIRNGIQVFAVSVGILALVGLQGVIPIEEVLQFQFTVLWIAILIGLCVGAAVGGVLYVSIGVMGLFLRFMIPRLNTMIESLDEAETERYSAIMQLLFGRSEEEEGKKS